MSNDIYDAIIVGAGFAGVTAARELSHKGYKTLVLEGRDRMGGRTWVDHRMGKNLEMGGTYVHWFQPNIWSEIMRYDLEVEKGPDLNLAYWIADGELHVGTEYEMFIKVKEGMEIFAKDASKYFPRPYAPFFNEEAVKEIDHISIADRLKEMESEVSKEILDLVEAYWCAYFCTDDLDAPALTQAYRWFALANNDWEILEDIFELYRFRNGTKELIDSIFNDSRAEIKLSTPVTAIEKTDNGHKVTTRGGKEFTAISVITAIPINTINNIEFKPALLPEKSQISTEKQTSSNGGKLWAKVRGVTNTTLLTAGSQYASSSLHTYSIDGDEAFIMGYVGNATKLDVEDTKQVEEFLRNWMPDIEVIDSTGHKWADDEFSLGTWPVLRKDQLTKYGNAVRKSEDGLYLAGSDYANGWAGFMDGAIESGLSTSERVDKYLKRKSKVKSTQ